MTYILHVYSFLGGKYFYFSLYGQQKKQSLNPHSELLKAKVSAQCHVTYLSCTLEIIWIFILKYKHSIVFSLLKQPHLFQNHRAAPFPNYFWRAIQPYCWTPEFLPSVLSISIGWTCDFFSLTCSQYKL